MLVIIKDLTLLLFPPAINLLLVLLGGLLLRGHPRLGKGCFAVALVSLYIAAIYPTPMLLSSALEDMPPLPENIVSRGEQAIVVLGGGRYAAAPEYFADTANALTLERLRYAAFIQQKTMLPVLVAGGRLRDETLAEASIMASVLRHSFQLGARWQEADSRNTAENALYSAALLRDAGIRHVYLVTHAAHMRRAVRMFEQAGLTVTPAPTAYTKLNSGRSLLTDFIPNSHALSATNRILHEYLGMLWYHLRY